MPVLFHIFFFDPTVPSLYGLETKQYKDGSHTPPYGGDALLYITCLRMIVKESILLKKSGVRGAARPESNTLHV